MVHLRYYAATTTRINSRMETTARIWEVTVATSWSTTYDGAAGCGGQHICCWISCYRLEVDPVAGIAQASAHRALELQTFLLTAVDERIKVAAPVNMISAIMQGNGQGEFRIYEVEAFSVILMRPESRNTCSTSVDEFNSGDWTRNTPREEFPEVQGIYELLRTPANVESVQINQPHNYSKESREAVYTFFNARLLGGAAPASQRFGSEPPESAGAFRQGTAN